MSDTKRPPAEPSTPPESDEEGPTAEHPTTTATKNAAGELFAALGHLRAAANILVDRVATDPGLRTAAAKAEETVRRAAGEAEKALAQMGAQAEPVAHRVADELGRAAKQVIDTTKHVVHDIETTLEGKPDPLPEEPSAPAAKSADDETETKDEPAKKP